MKTSRLLLVSTLVVASALLAGCATAPITPAEPQPGRYYVDGAYVQAVERVARSRGVSVYWVNAPESKAKADDRVGGN